jgi:PKD repeat protein
VVTRGYLPSSVVAPVANFSANPVLGSAPFLVAFTDLSTNTPTSWLWKFGDGGTSTLQNPQHTYNYPGQYTVSLTATNASGSNTKTLVNYITVGKKPPEPVKKRPDDGTGTARKRRMAERRRLTRQMDIDIAMAIILMEEQDD